LACYSPNTASAMSVVKLSTASAAVLETEATQRLNTGSSQRRHGGKALTTTSKAWSVLTGYKGKK